MRRYNDAEVAAIFERATTTQEDVRRLPVSREGMTLEELQSIGSEVGIPANLIAAAANSLGQVGQTTTRGALGLPLRVERIVSVPRPLSDAEWERVIVQLREIFDAQGVAKAEGSLRQWTNGNLQA